MKTDSKLLAAIMAQARPPVEGARPTLLDLIILHTKVRE